MVRKYPTLMIAEPGSSLTAALNPRLAEKGCQVKAVDDLNHALGTLQSEKIHVLVMDVRMAHATDCEAIPMIRGVSRHLPMMATTEENNPEQGSTTRRQGYSLLSRYFLRYGRADVGNWYRHHAFHNMAGEGWRYQSQENLRRLAGSWEPAALRSSFPHGGEGSTGKSMECFRVW